MLVKAIIALEWGEKIRDSASSTCSATEFSIEFYRVSPKKKSRVMYYCDRFSIDFRKIRGTTTTTTSSHSFVYGVVNIHSLDFTRTLAHLCNVQRLSRRVTRSPSYQLTLFPVSHTVVQ
ncbi:hypothetical protein TSAR_014098 [Trichomalopsis sarcophagae]|uniref:Uncharacterized protein n=1 Tax=Trichomalopsis sarcophagae TaxID=543379 RepID=A0A232FMX8_9HYME|nr:hypothetical protein TSAR_014098 [Trichomalopsis sarcophagae]